MKLADITMGETYTVKVPDRLNPDNPMWLSAGDTFDLTVTNVVGDEVIGVRLWEGAVTVRLTPEQAARFGLPDDRPYAVFGGLVDAGTGELIAAPLPESEDCAVPTRWVHPHGRRFYGR